MRAALWAITVLFVLGVAASAWAAPIQLSPATERYDIGGRVDLCEDPSATWTISDVTGDKADCFSPSETAIPSKGLSSSAWWLRVELENASPKPQARLFELGRATLDHVELYYPEGFTPRVKDNERFRAFSERDVAHRNHIFRVELPPTSTTTLHVRLTSTSELFFPVRVWSPDALRRHERDEALFLGFFYGAVFLIALYHLVLFFKARDSYLVFFASYIAAFGLWMAFVDGYPYAWFESAAPRWGNTPVLIVGWLSVVLAVRFSQLFLQTRLRAPRLHRALHGSYFLCAGTVSMFLLGVIDWRTVNWVTSLCFVTVYPGLLLTGVVAWRSGLRGAGWYCISWTVWLAGGIVGALWLAGLVAWSDHESANLLRWAVFSEAMCMSVALAIRLETLTSENVEAKALALAQAQLAEAERSAALGRLMAGLLHEVNSPLGALRSAAGSLGKTFEIVAKHTPHAEESRDAMKTRRALKAGGELSNTIDEASARIGKVIDSLKRFVAVDEAAKKRVDVRQGLDGALTLVTSSLSDIEVTKDYPSEPAKALCAPSKLNHALLELLSRAIERMPDGGTLSLSVASDEAGVRISIRDSGARIPEAELATMFQLGFHSREGRMQMRLGLHLAKQAVEEVGGTLTVESEDSGTTAAITLPA